MHDSSTCCTMVRPRLLKSCFKKHKDIGAQHMQDTVTAKSLESLACRQYHQRISMHVFTAQSLPRKLLWAIMLSIAAIALLYSVDRSSQVVFSRKNSYRDIGGLRCGRNCIFLLVLNVQFKSSSCDLYARKQSNSNFSLTYLV